MRCNAVDISVTSQIRTYIFGYEPQYVGLIRHATSLSMLEYPENLNLPS